MFYLLLIITSSTSSGALTSQKIPMISEKRCKAEMEVYDNSTIVFGGQLGPQVRAFCIKAK